MLQKLNIKKGSEMKNQKYKRDLTNNDKYALPNVMNSEENI
jgi:hypothetical protein